MEASVLKLFFQQYKEDEARPSFDSDSEDSGLSLIFEYIWIYLSSILNFVQLHEEVLSTSSSSSSDHSGDADRDMSNTGDTNYLQDGVAEGQLWICKKPNKQLHC